MTDLFQGPAQQPESRALTRGLWGRRIVVALFVAIIVLALAGFAGQRGTTEHAAGDAATLSVAAPDTVRGGIFFQARVTVAAKDDLEHPRIVLGRGWVEGLQVNSIEPGAQSEASRDGRLVLSYDKLAAGDTLALWFQFQVNPTQPGRRDFSVELDDAERPIARVDRKLRVLP
jgi:hypothetical protein